MLLENLFVALKGGKVVKVIGNKNIVIQDVQGSEITINDISELEERLAKLIDFFKTPLYFIVFADKIKPQEWRPFGDRTILELIQACTSNISNADAIVWFIDPAKQIDNKIEDDLKSIKGKSILIFNTAYNYCQLFKEIFNQYEIGGCIAIPEVEFDKINLGTLITTRNNESRMHSRKKTYHYALKNIKSDMDVMEAINNIISAYMSGYNYNKASIVANNPHDKSSSSNEIIRL